MKLTLVRKRARGGVDFSRAAGRDGVGGDVDGATPPRVGPGAYYPSYAAVEPDETAIGFSRAGRPIGVGVGVGAASAGDEDGDGDVLELDPRRRVRARGRAQGDGRSRPRARGEPARGGDGA